MFRTLEKKTRSFKHDTSLVPREFLKLSVDTVKSKQCRKSLTAQGRPVTLEIATTITSCFSNLKTCIYQKQWRRPFWAVQLWHQNINILTFPCWIAWIVHMEDASFMGANLSSWLEKLDVKGTFQTPFMINYDRT